MKAAPFTYHDPRTTDDALGLLGTLENARLLAGGQSLVPMMNFRIAAPDHLIDLNTVEGLSFIREEGAQIRIGAMTRQRELEFSDTLSARLPVLGQALSNVGHRQTRNRGTIGGSLCHLDPSAELVCVASLLDGHVTVASKSASRDIPMSEWAAGLMTTALEAEEMMLSVTLTPWQRTHGHAFVEFSRRHGDFAIVAAAALVELGPDDQIRRAALCVSGVAPVPVRMSSAEALLEGQRPSQEALRAAAIEAAKVDAISDHQITSAYRKHLTRVLSMRALEQAVSRARNTNG